MGGSTKRVEVKGRGTNVLDEGVVVVGIKEESTDSSHVVGLAAAVLEIEQDLNGLTEGKV